jgi:hypothetical protein
VSKETVRHIQARVPDDMYAAMKILAVSRSMNLQQLLETIIKRALEDPKNHVAVSAAGYEDPNIRKFVKFMETAPDALKGAVAGIMDGFFLMSKR